MLLVSYVSWVQGIDLKIFYQMEKNWGYTKGAKVSTVGWESLPPCLLTVSTLLMMVDCSWQTQQIKMPTRRGLMTLLAWSIATWTPSSSSTPTSSSSALKLHNLSKHKDSTSRRFIMNSSLAVSKRCDMCAFPILAGERPSLPLHSHDIIDLFVV